MPKRRPKPFHFGTKFRETRARKLSATVHHEAIWINGNVVLHLTPSARKRLIRLLLDASVPVKGLWADCDYSYIDTRIAPGKQR